MRRVITILLAAILILVLAACSKEKNSVSFEDSCWEQVEDYETTILEDGTVSVSLYAPDYTALLELLVENGVAEELTVEMLTEAAEDNPDAVKEYTFVVESSDDESIREKLLEQIAYEMLILAMEGYMG